MDHNRTIGTGFAFTDGGIFLEPFSLKLPEQVKPAVPSATLVGSDVLRYPADAPQLSMIQAKIIQPSPMPLTNALSAP